MTPGTVAHPVGHDPYARFAPYYDLLYERKMDYDEETRWLIRAFARFGNDVRSVLDLGCGTGNHALRLAAKGYEVVGVDRSAPQIAVARRKARRRRLRVEFVRGGMATFRLPRRFDAVICLFGSWDYLVDLREVRAALRRVHASLREGGLFVCEFWDVRGVRDGHRSWDHVCGDVSLIRWGSSAFDRRAQIVTLTMSHLTYRGRRVLEEFMETHRLRAYRRAEIGQLLREHGFRVLGWFGHPDGGFRPPAGGHNVVVVAVRRGVK
ncbi:MAG TPA: class I SAM-dependent methyltransferase [Thermoplasmata archaeon]|nr:class I SAM-dependent methyltransferase [Thermoplasmata archaeon]